MLLVVQCGSLGGGEGGCSSETCYIGGGVSALGALRVNMHRVELHFEHLESLGCSTSTLPGFKSSRAHGPEKVTGGEQVREPTRTGGLEKITSRPDGLSDESRRVQRADETHGKSRTSPLHYKSGTRTP